MGNQTSSSRRKKSRKNGHGGSLCRTISQPLDEGPDVDTLGFPYHVVREIFLHVDIRDLATAMLVCKEWRSLIDCCSFLRDYVRIHQGWTPTDNHWGDSHVVLVWRDSHSARVPPKLTRQSSMTSSTELYVFKPFPALWACDVMTPADWEPPEGGLGVHHEFIRAARWLQTLVAEVNACGLANQIQACLFKWYRSRLPTAQEVLHAFHAHPNMIHTVTPARNLVANEVAFSCKSLPSGTDRSDTSGQVNNKFISKLRGLFGKRPVVSFSCSVEVVKPSPAFLVTHIADGLAGGILYAANI